MSLLAFKKSSLAGKTKKAPLVSLEQIRLENPDLDDSQDSLLSDHDLEDDFQARLQSEIKPTKLFRNDEKALIDLFEEIHLLTENQQPVDWSESLTISTQQPITVTNVEDDFLREKAIYQSTLSSVDVAIQRLEHSNIKYRRPDDYFTEMVKTDEHMFKLKNHLLNISKQKEKRTNMLQEIRMKKFAKKVQIDTHIKRQKHKAEDLAVVKRWRLERENNPKMDKFPTTLLDPADPLRKQILARADKKDLHPLKSKKRTAKDAKYAYGPRKKSKFDQDGFKSDKKYSDRHQQNRPKSHPLSFQPREDGNAKYTGTRSGKKSSAHTNRPGKQNRSKHRDKAKSKF